MRREIKILVDLFGPGLALAAMLGCFAMLIL